MIHLLQEKDKKQKSMRPRIDKNRFQQIVKGILFFYKTPERLIIPKRIEFNFNALYKNLLLN